MADMCDVLGGNRTLEVRVAYFKPPFPVFETDREIPFATHAVMYLHAFPCGDIGRNAPCPEIIQQDGVLKR